MISLDLFASVVFFSIGLYLYARRPRSSLAHLPLPPGPRKLPVIGNLLDLPSGFEWYTYHKWSKELNTDVIHLNVTGTNIIVLDTSEAATELLERRSSIYSNRARMPMINELMGWDFNFGFIEYGERWRARRRLFHHFFHPSAATRFHPHEKRATNDLLRRLLDSPEDFRNHVRHMAGATIMSVGYGLDVETQNDPYITTAERSVHHLFEAAVPGAFLVDSIPSLKKVPEWIPGAGFKKKAREWRVLSQKMVTLPFKAAKSNIAKGITTPSFVLYSMRAIDENGNKAQQEEDIQSVAGTIYTAGSDTTVSAILSFILAMLTNPGAMKKAQNEIDLVIGRGHLPTFEDEPSMPYVTAVVKETLRWRDVAPIAVPHLVDIEDEYKGYRIPKNSIIIPNAWAMLHDEDIYPDPFTFNPDRFIKDGKFNKEVRDPGHAIFGFGRRICPGRFMAYDSIWIAIGSILATFDITKALDDNGDTIEPSHEYSSALAIMPLPFKCSIKPRSKESEALIRSTILNVDEVEELF